ncbi:MAG TPA: DUF2797 domain-containing protein [Candidatus Binatia bacterium]|nr:DUF2797 domain-containing protein [Candidatus Binatia bacterium]
MEKPHGPLQKMRAQAETPVAYSLPVGTHQVPLNPCLGKTFHLVWSGAIFCIGCGRPTKRSFNRGYCYPCCRSLACCDLCVVKPELCHYAQGTCREPTWGLAHCMQPHYVYLANTAGVKVGITRASQLPVRWLDQGAVQALPVFRVPSRYQAGLLEVALKQYVTDRTDWRRMLRGEPEPHDLQARRDELLSRCGDNLITAVPPADGQPSTLLGEAEAHTFTYPILRYPPRVTALDFHKTPHVAGTLLGIKGQYLLLDTGVLNVRKFAGYEVTVTVPATFP